VPARGDLSMSGSEASLLRPQSYALPKAFSYSGGTIHM
jgi:hypothetical protein